jgi:hypothetical protein
MDEITGQESGGDFRGSKLETLTIFKEPPPNSFLESSTSASQGRDSRIIGGVSRGAAALAKQAKIAAS